MGGTDSVQEEILAPDSAGGSHRWTESWDPCDEALPKSCIMGTWFSLQNPGCKGTVIGIWVKPLVAKGQFPSGGQLRLSPGAPLVCCAILREATLAARDTASGEPRALGMQPNDPVCVITKAFIHRGKCAKSSCSLLPYSIFSEGKGPNISIAIPSLPWNGRS